jgi:hypothetical protein
MFSSEVLMRVLMFTVTALLALAASTGAAAGSGCNDDKCCTKAACCQHDAEEFALEPMEAGLSVVAPGLEWPAQDVRPVREYAKVLFRDPVRIGDRVLIGTYVIEHDEGRMARGLPCTYIYAADDRRVPVVAFHCRHLDRKPNPKATVTLQPLRDPTTRMFKLVEFQFEDSDEGHGVPDGR